MKSIIWFRHLHSNIVDFESRKCFCHTRLFCLEKPIPDISASTTLYKLRMVLIGMVACKNKKFQTSKLERDCVDIFNIQDPVWTVLRSILDILFETIWCHLTESDFRLWKVIKWVAPIIIDDYYSDNLILWWDRSKRARAVPSFEPEGNERNLDKPRANSHQAEKNELQSEITSKLYSLISSWSSLVDFRLVDGPNSRLNQNHHFKNLSNQCPSSLENEMIASLKNNCSRRNICGDKTISRFYQFQVRILIWGFDWKLPQ